MKEKRKKRKGVNKEKGKKEKERQKRKQGNKKNNKQMVKYDIGGGVSRTALMVDMYLLCATVLNRSGGPLRSTEPFDPYGVPRAVARTTNRRTFLVLHRRVFR